MNNEGLNVMVRFISIKRNFQRSDIVPGIAINTNKTSILRPSSQGVSE